MMPGDPDPLPAGSYRRSLRLKGYDYSQAGAYFVTICTENRRPLLGEIVEGQMHLGPAGRIADSVWADLPRRFPGVELDVYVVMPNHVHAIILLPDRTAQGQGTARHPALGDIVRAFKAVSTRLAHTSHVPDFAWQRDYYDRVIRNERDLAAIRQYIVDNPCKWELDRDNPRVQAGTVKRRAR